ncbi:MAG: glutaredoxin family protein [Archaeoglobaceae archaeon]|nr:glutaredoxin family protein [Archaeoglobaceae archaeon]MDW8118287.1 glutaredoxin family protein [Archaeoglobaceae archaeon]
MADITMFGLTTCPHCKRTLEYLKMAKVEVDVVWVDKLSEEERKKTIEKIYNISKSYSVPLVVKGDKWVLGFNREKLDELIKG